MDGLFLIKHELHHSAEELKELWTSGNYTCVEHSDNYMCVEHSDNYTCVEITN